MKAFKKLALVTAIAAAPFAQAELVAIDDAVMSDMTGQAGISIELSAEVSIGSVVYTDTANADAGDIGGGSLAITGIVLGGNDGSGNVSGALDGIKIDIDVDDADGLIIHLGATDNGGVLTGSDSVDFGLSVESASLNGGANLISGMSITGNLGPVDVEIANNGTIGIDAYFEVTNGSLDVDVLGLGVTNLTIGDNASPILTGRNQSNIENFQDYVVSITPALTAADDARTTAQADLVTVESGLVAANTALTDAQAIVDDPASTPTQVSDAQAIVTTQEGTIATLEGNQTALVAGIASYTTAINDATVGGVQNMAYVGMTISTGTTGYGKLNGTGPGDWSADTIAVTSALVVTIDAMNMDIGMDLAMGTAVNATTGAAVSTSLGSVVINDLNLSGTTLKIYGH